MDVSRAYGDSDDVVIYDSSSESSKSSTQERYNDIYIVHKDDPNFKSYRLVAKQSGNHCMQWITDCMPMPRCGDKVGFAEDLERDDCAATKEYTEVVSNQYLAGEAESANIEMIVFFVPKGKSFCKPLTPEIVGSVIRNKKKAMDMFLALSTICVPGFNRESFLKYPLNQWINRYNSLLGHADEYISGFILVKKIAKGDLYVEIVCASSKKGFVNPEKTGLEQFIDWARANGYKRIYLSSLPYVMPYYYKLGFRVDSADQQDQRIPNPPEGQKAWCFGYPDRDTKFQKYMQILSEKGIGHKSTDKESNCDPVEVFNCNRGLLTKDECEDIYQRCYDNGFRMVINL
jgi:hypothetical protein